MAGMLRCCALALLLPLLAHAQAGFAVERSTLPNGLDLLLHVDRKTPIVHVNIRIRTGSKHEKPLEVRSTTTRGEFLKTTSLENSTSFA